MDRAALRSRLRSLTGVHMTTLLSDADANTILNEAYQGIVGAADWRFLYAEGNLTTTAGTAVYSLPSGVDRADTVAIAAGGWLRRRPLAELDREPTHRRSDSTWAWAPQADGKVELFPTPDAVATYRVRGWANPSDMATDTDVPVFDSEYHVAVAYEAAAIVLEQEGDDSGRAQQYRQEVARILGRMGLRYLPDGGEIAYPPAGAQEEDA